MQSVQKKAQLIAEGNINIGNTKIPFPLSKSSAGPSVGSSLIISFSGKRVKLKISEKKEKFSLKENNGKYQILKNGKLFLNDVQLIPTIMHAPNQAFINIQASCIFKCKFCSTPNIKGKNFSAEKWTELILNASKNKNFEGVAITSGVAKNVDETIEKIVKVVKGVREKLNCEIGVEPYTIKVEHLKKLKKAGATELKLNIHSFDYEIFEKICPNLNYNGIKNALRRGVEIFGKNKVCSNVIIGLGEKEKNIIEGVEEFAKLGILTNLRALRISEENFNNLKKIINLEKFNPKKLLKLAKRQKEIFEKYGLKIKKFKTMCFSCGCCDILPSEV